MVMSFGFVFFIELSQSSRGKERVSNLWSRRIETSNRSVQRSNMCNV